MDIEITLVDRNAIINFGKWLLYYYLPEAKVSLHAEALFHSIGMANQTTDPEKSIVQKQIVDRIYGHYEACVTRFFIAEKHYSQELQEQDWYADQRR